MQAISARRFPAGYSSRMRLASAANASSRSFLPSRSVFSSGRIPSQGPPLTRRCHGALHNRKRNQPLDVLASQTDAFLRDVPQELGGEKPATLGVGARLIADLMSPPDLPVQVGETLLG